MELYYFFHAKINTKKKNINFPVACIISVFGFYAFDSLISELININSIVAKNSLILINRITYSNAYSILLNEKENQSIIKRYIQKLRHNSSPYENFR